MTTAEVIKEISLRTGIPENKVRKSVLDFSRDANTLIARKATGGFTIPNLGYVAASMRWTTEYIEMKLKHMEHILNKRKDLFANPGIYRTIFSSYIDDTFACINLIAENEHIKNGSYTSSTAGKKIEIDKERVAEYLRRLQLIINEFPVDRERKKYQEIQKICLRRMYKQGILQVPEHKNSEMQSMLVRPKR